MVRGLQSARPEGAVDRPARTCVGCRRRRPRSELLRFVVDERGHLRVDPELRAPGRGAHACASAACVTRGLGQGFARSLRRKVAFAEPARFVAETRSALEAAASELESRAGRDGRLRARDPLLERRLVRLRAQALELAGASGAPAALV